MNWQCAVALSYNLYITGQTASTLIVVCLSMWTKLSRRAKTGNALVYLMTKQDRHFFNLQVNLPRTDLQNPSCGLKPGLPTELDAHQPPLRQQTLGMGFTPTHLQFYSLTGSPKTRIKISMVPGSLEDSTTCWTALQSWLKRKGMASNETIT